VSQPAVNVLHTGTSTQLRRPASSRWASRTCI